MSGEINQFGPIATTDLGNNTAFVSFPYDATVNFELRKEFNAASRGADGKDVSQVSTVKDAAGNFGYLIALQGKQTIADVHAWAGKMDKQGYFADKTVGQIKSTAFMAANPDLAKLPGIAVKVIGGQLAVEMPRNEQGQAAMRELGAHWRPGSKGINSKTGQAYENKGSWRFDLGDKDQTTIKSALMRASAGVLDMQGTADRVKGLAPAHEGITLQLIPGNPNPNARGAAPHDRVLLMTPKDDVANTLLKEGGAFAWNKGLGGFVAEASKSAEIKTTLDALGTYYDGMVVPPSADRPGMTTEKLDMLAKAPAQAKTPDDVTNIKAAYKHIAETFSLEERAALANNKPGEHANDPAGRIAGLSDKNFAAVAAVVTTVERSHAQVQANEITAAQAAISQAQAQAIQSPTQQQSLGR